MADLEQMFRALENADKAGDTAAAGEIASMIREAQARKNPNRNADGTYGKPPPEMVPIKTPDGRDFYADAALAAERQLKKQPILGPASQYFRGVPFIGSAQDEIVGGDPLTREISRQVQIQSEDDPGSTLVRTGSTILNAAPMLAGGLAFAPRLAAPTTAGKMVQGSAFGGVAGATEGATYGALDAREGERVRGGVQGGVEGGVIGATIGGAFPLAGKTVQEIARYLGGRAKGLRSSDVKTVASELGISTAAARVVKNALEANDLDAAARELARAGDQSMLSDAGPGAQSLLKNAAQRSPVGGKIARDAVDARAAEARELLEGSLDRIMGPPKGVREIQSGISSRTAKVRQAAYDRAYGQPINYETGGKGEAILGVLERVPSRTLQRAIDEANEAMQAAGVQNQQILAEVAEDGAVTFRDMPNVQQVDQIKRALQDISRKEEDAVTGKTTAAGMRASKLAQDLNAALADAVPDYSRAVRLGGDKIAEERAADIGRKLLRPGTTPEEVARAIGPNSSREARQAAKDALRGDIEDRLSTVSRVVSDGNTDAREAMKLVRDMSSRAAIKKVEMVLGKSAARDLHKALDDATVRLELRAAIAMRSDTAQNLGVAETVKNLTEPGMLGRIAEGEPAQAFKRLVQALTGKSPEARVARQQGIFEEVATALTQIRGRDAQRALHIVNKAIKTEEISDAGARMVARALVVPAASGAYQYTRPVSAQ